ncbi:MAG: DUF2240 family protein [Candidatus Thermoplasmatota archaeon]
MFDEARIVLAFIFKRSGKTKLTEAEIYVPLSLELNWFTVQEAQAFVRYCTVNKLIAEEQGVFTPTFEIADIQIPIGFIPENKKYSLTTSSEVQKNILNVLAETLSMHLNQDIQKTFEEIARQAAEKKITSELAALFLMYLHALPYERFVDPVERRLFTENI